ncbi:2Fe-2S iron-sulfur cluster binding domain-containing protein [Candidatus Sumerlaeota bacterium]|nr:2Fe-2S iron-sulfur cluster binding domain-containing protein [Candidatus Sumerlaeota bacterium]
MPRTFKATFLPMNVTVEVDPSQAPFGRMGEPGSILDIAQLAPREIYLDHVCGGVCACATCHVKVRQGLESCNPQSEDEIDMLTMADDVEESVSRLACQTIPDGSQNLIIEIPDQ